MPRGFERKKSNHDTGAINDCMCALYTVPTSPLHVVGI
jgi:hypothetical protein